MRSSCEGRSSRVRFGSDVVLGIEREGDARGNGGADKVLAKYGYRLPLEIDPRTMPIPLNTFSVAVGGGPQAAEPCVLLAPPEISRHDALHAARRDSESLEIVA